MTFTMMVSAPIICVGGIVLALNQDVMLSSLLLVAVPLLAIIVGLIIWRMRPLFRLMQERIDGINSVLREQITGVRVVRAFVRDGRERTRFAGSNTELLEVGLGAGRLMALMFPSVMLVLNLSSVAVLWFGGHLVASRRDADRLADRLPELSLQILMSVMMATFMFMMVPRAEVCAERIVEVLDTEPDIIQPTNPVRRPATRGHLDLRDVEFRYPGAEEPVLHGISLAARPGEITAIIGGTGSGKTTLLNLIPRLMDVTGGSVLVDGVNVRDLDPAVLSGAIGLVPQKPYLFSGTVASNLRYGNQDATDEDLWRALEIAQARDFVEQMPGGLEATIAQGGTNVSGGQRQRLAIARALVHRPEIYLFDDSFSALDYATDAELRAALAQETTDATVVIVAQRVSTIRHADQDRGLRCGTGGRHRYARRADEHQRDLPGDRALPADRAGGRVSSDGIGTPQPPGRTPHRPPRGPLAVSRRRGPPPEASEAPAREAMSGERPTPRRGPGPTPGTVPGAGRGPAASWAAGPLRSRWTSGAPVVGWCGTLRPERPLAAVALALAAASVTLSVLGPMILGHATDLIFAGVVSRQIPPGVTQAEAVARLRQQGQGTLANMISSMHLTATRGVDFSQVGRVLLTALVDLRGLLGGQPDAGPRHHHHRPARGLPDARPGPGQAIPAAAELLRPPAPRRDPQPGDQRHRQPRAIDAADAEPDGDVSAHHRRRFDDDVRHLAAARADRAGDRAGLGLPRGADRQARPAAVRPAVVVRPASSTATSRRCTRGIRSSRSSASASRPWTPSPSTTTSCSAPVSGLSSSPAPSSR